MKLISNLLTLGCFILLTTGFSQTAVTKLSVNNPEMRPDKNIIENLSSSKDYSSLLSSLKSADLEETLESIGPFTIFAPTNTAFNKLSKSTLDNFMKPENKGLLSTILTYHLVSGKMDSKDLTSLVEKGGGKAELVTVSGGKLIVTLKENRLVVTDEKGNSATVITKDIYQSNGVLFVVDKVLMPK